jgi:hypothetical protein
MGLHGNVRSHVAALGELISHARLRTTGNRLTHIGKTEHRGSSELTSPSGRTGLASLPVTTAPARIPVMPPKRSDLGKLSAAVALGPW